MSISGHSGGWVPTGFQAIVGLWAWLVVVVAHVLFRLWGRPGADPVRPSGPIE